MSLKRLHQVFIGQELTEATAFDNSDTTTHALFTAGKGSYLVIDPTIEYELPRFQRNINRSSLTQLQGLSGIRQGTVRFGLELTGSSAFATVPQIGLPLRACGFRQEKLFYLTIGAVTGGPFRHGEVVNQATSLATFTVVGDTYNGQTVLWGVQENELGTGTVSATGALTGASSGATATPSVLTGYTAGVGSAAYGWWPQSFALSYVRTNASGVVTAAISEGDLLQGVTSGSLFQAFKAYPIAAGATLIRCRRVTGHVTPTGEVFNNVTSGQAANFATATSVPEAQLEIPSLSLGIAKDGVRESIRFSRGTVSATGTIGEPMILNFEFKGGFDAIADQGNLSGVTFGQSVPPVLIDADLALGHSATTFAQEYVPCIRTITLAMNNDVQFVECMADSSGIFNTQITGRKPTGTIDPDLLPESVFSYMNDFLNNTAYRARFTVGSTLGNKFLMTLPALSTTGAPTGDRNGISTRQIAFEMTGGSQTVSALNTENELVIIAPFL